MIKCERKKLTAVIAVLFLVALMFRFYRLSNQSLWMDEISSVATARVLLEQIVERSAQNNSLPTYFLLLRPIVGTSNEHIETKARIISVVAGALSVPVLIGLVLVWRKDCAIACIAGLLLAVNPLHVWYSQEARGYALMLLLGLSCLLSFELARSREKTGWWLGYIIFALLATAVHKTGLVFPMICAGTDLWQAFRKRLSVNSLAPHLVLVAVAALLLIEPSRPPAKEYGRAGSILEIFYTAMTFVGGYSFGPSLTDIQNDGAKLAVLHHLTQTALIGAVLLIIAGVLICARRAALCGKEALLTVLSIGMVFAGALVSRFPYNIRYALPALFGFLALIAALPLFVRKRMVWQSTLAAVLVINLWADYQWFFVPAYRKGDSRAVAHWLTQHQPQAKSWTVLPDYLGYSVKWYLEGQPEIIGGYVPPKAPQTTAFPPLPEIG